MNKKFYVYKTTNLINGKTYIGAHHGHIKDGYIGSGTAIKKAIKKYGKSNFKKEIIKITETRESMYEYEKQLVTEDVVKDPNNYNLMVGGFAVTTRPKTHKVVVIDKNGSITEVDNTDTRYLSGELKHISKGKVTVRKNNQCFTVDVNDPRYLSGELKHISTNQINVRDKNGDTFAVSVDDERYLSGELVAASKGMIKVKDINTSEISYVHITDPKYLSGELVVESKEFSMAITLDGKVIKVSRQDPRLKNGILIRYRNNMKNSYKLK